MVKQKYQLMNHVLIWWEESCNPLMDKSQLHNVFVQPLSGLWYQDLIIIVLILSLAAKVKPVCHSYVIRSIFKSLDLISVSQWSCLPCSMICLKTDRGDCFELVAALLYRSFSSL